METAKFGIERETLEKIIEIFKRYKQVKKVCIFGSRARGDFKKGSDIDICVWLDDNGENIIYRIEDELEEINIILLFDIVVFNNITKESLKNSILKEGVIIYEREDNGKI